MHSNPTKTLLLDLHSCHSCREIVEFTLSEIAGSLGADRAAWSEFNSQKGFSRVEWCKGSMHLKDEYVPIIDKFIAKQHPASKHIDLFGDCGRVFRINEFVSQQAFEKTELYNEGYAPTGGRYQLGLQVHGSRFGFSTATFWRSSKDFGDAEERLLKELAPHFSLAYGRLLKIQQLSEAPLFATNSTSREYPFLSFTGDFYLRDANKPASELLESLPDFDGSKLPICIIDAITQNGSRNSHVHTELFIGSDRYLLSGHTHSGGPTRYIALIPLEKSVSGTLRGDFSALSRRQIEVVQWVARGKSNSEIASILGISPRTVEKHLENIFHTLRIENRYALIATLSGINIDLLR